MISAGSGCPAANGLPHGSHGAPAEATSDGPRSLRKPSPTASTTGTPPWTSPSASEPCGSISWKPATSTDPSTDTASPIARITRSSTKLTISPTSTSKTIASSPVARVMPISAGASGGLFPSAAWIWTAAADLAATLSPCSRASMAHACGSPPPPSTRHGMTTSNQNTSKNASIRSAWSAPKSSARKSPSSSAAAAKKTSAKPSNPSKPSAAAKLSSAAASNNSKQTVSS